MGIRTRVVYEMLERNEATEKSEKQRKGKYEIKITDCIG